MQLYISDRPFCRTSKRSSPGRWKDLYFGDPRGEKGGEIESRTVSKIISEDPSKAARRTEVNHNDWSGN